jgi:hypothetical protein
LVPALTALGAVACAHREDAPAVGYTESHSESQRVRWRLTDVHYFVSDRRCDQGPFEIQVQDPAGMKGNDYALYAYSEHGMSGHVGISSRLCDSDYSSEDAFAPKTYLPNRRLVDNSACTLSPDEIAESHGGTTAQPAAAATPPPNATVGRTSEQPVSAPRVLREIPRPTESPAGLRTLVGSVRFVDYRKTYPCGMGKVVFRIWSTEPNDLGGVTFVVGHRIPELIGSVADLEQAQQSEAEERRRAEHKQPPPPMPEAVPSPPPTVPAPTPKWAISPTAPPPARPESRPPRPSAHAEWIAGYWTWATDEAEWLWLAGRWRVPPEDVATDQTVHAPSPPPAPRTEPAPPPPTRSRLLVWIPGYWQWDGRTFVWVTGNWQLAPVGNPVWVPDRWEIRGGFSVFVPGGWRRR